MEAAEPTSLTLRVWRNPPSIILGATSSIRGEVNEECASREEIPVLRRITGGGTVYHDYGNVNYTLVVSRSPTATARSIDYVYGVLLKGLVEAVRLLSSTTPRVVNTSDVVVGGYKVSGNAAAMRRNKYMLHGTLLINADIEKIYRCLIIPPRTRKYPGEVDPAKYRVANLEELTGRKIGQTLVIEALVKGFAKTLRAKPYYDTPSRRELEKAKQLENSKYRKPWWINRFP